MKKQTPLNGLVIRTAVVRRASLGFIYACDLEKERKEIPHAIAFTWRAGAFSQVEIDYDAHTACIIQEPEPALVDASEWGYYTVETRNGASAADLFETSHPPPKERRSGGIRSISEIGGKAYAVGIRGMVYRLDELTTWTRIDDGLPNSFNAQAIHGFNASDLYAVGRDGELWQRKGETWIRRELPTERNLTAVRCAGDGVVYIGGYGGTLIRGRDDKWEIVDQKETNADIWDFEWFKGQLYISTMSSLYQLIKGAVVPVDFGGDTPKSCYQLSAADDVMWSNGEFDVMAFDGTSWTRVV